MGAAECDALLVRAQGGEQAAWSHLALLVRRELAILAALYAADQDMVDAACEDCWPTAQRWLAEQRQPQPPQNGLWMGAPQPESGTLLVRLREEAIAMLRQQLTAYDRRAIAEKDAVRHLIAQSGCEALPRTVAEVPDVLPLMQGKLKHTPPSAQGLLAKRYREGLPLAQIADLAGRPVGDVAQAMCLARNAVDWHPQVVRQSDPGQRDFCLLIEEFIDGTLAGELQVGLAQILLDDLAQTAFFVRQIRLDLVLTACLRAADIDAAQLLSQERSAPPSHDSDRRSATSDRAISQESRQAPSAGRIPRARKTGASESDARLWLGIGAGVVAVVVVGVAFAMFTPAKPLPRPSTATDTTVVDPVAGKDKPVEHPAAPAVANDDAMRIEAGLPTVKRADARQRVQPGGMLRGGEAFDTDASVGPVVLALSAGRKLTVGVNSAIGGVQLGAGTSEIVILERGYVRIDAPTAARGVAVRVGTIGFAGEGAVFSVTTLSTGQRVEVSRGTVRIQRGGAQIGMLLAGEAGVLNNSGDMTVTSSGTFVLGINLAGAGLTIDGHRWKSQRHAEADGLSVSGGTVGTMPMASEVDAALRPLLETALAGSPLRLSQNLPDGSYDVVCWVVGRPGAAVGALTVSGQSAAEADAVSGDSAALNANGWRKLWPRRCLVNGGRLDLGYSGNEQQRLAGVMIQANATGAGGKATGHLPPTVFLDDPADGVNLPAPVALTFKADAYAPDSGIRSIEFLVDGNKVGEATAPPYLYAWSGQTPGVHQITARALAANNLTATSASVSLTVRPAEKSTASPTTPAQTGGLLVVDDFERDAAGWDYVGGWEFPGAKGATARDAGAAHGGSYAFRLDYDFTGGGAYVGTWKKLENLTAPDVTEFHLWVKTAGLAALGVRLLDGSDQLHQSSVRLKPTSEWQEVVVKVAEATGGEHWGGANDAKWHPRAKGIGLNIGKDNATVPGTLWIDDFSVVLAPTKP